MYQNNRAKETFKKTLKIPGSFFMLFQGNFDQSFPGEIFKKTPGIFKVLLKNLISIGI
jgi:hypothetical protein